MVHSVEVSDEGVADVSVLLTIVGCPASERISKDIHTAVTAVAAVTHLNLTLGVMTAEQRETFVNIVRGDKALKAPQFTAESLTRVIAVTSGKGGVGKSSVTANLAVELAHRGLNVGLIDADVFGFSIPGLLGLTPDDRPTRVGDLILPPEAHGVKVISIGMFLGEGESRHTAVAWRGPMLHRTIEQFLNDVWFGDLDILLLDLPPGTGDIALTVGQLLPHAEVLVVTTPQSAASEVAVRSGFLAHKTGQRLIGVVENMSGFTQADGSVVNLFGTGGGAEVASALTSEIASAPGENITVPLVATIPLSVALREGGDVGMPAVLTHPDDAAVIALKELATTVQRRPSTLAGTSLPVRPA
jgi:ATP-binding protein involved in chromosome partitioning